VIFKALWLVRLDGEGESTVIAGRFFVGEGFSRRIETVLSSLTSTAVVDMELLCIPL
jgi:hypothetical protein